MRSRLNLVALAALAACASAPAPAPAAGDGVPSASSPIALAADERTVWVANPDADTVTAVNAATLEAGAPVPVGREPWSLAVTPGGAVVVANRASGTLTVLDGAQRDDVPVGAEPGGVALSPTGRTAYVTASSDGELVVVDVPSRRVTARVEVGPLPWALAVTDDGDADDLDETIVVTHRVSRARPGGVEGRDDAREGRLTRLDAATLTPSDVTLPPQAFGFPNALEGLAVTGDEVIVAHLLDAPDYPRTFETTVSGALSTVPLRAASGDAARTLNLNDPAFSAPTNFPRAVAVTASGDTAFVALAGSDTVMGVDRRDPGAARLIGFWPAGRNPRGLVVTRDARRAYVMNYLSRDVSVLDLEDRRARREVRRVPVTPETLDATVLRGKTLFNNASDPRLSHLGWISCASCHPDGGADGTTWLTPDGPRQTQPLWHLDGTAPFHASATRDEVQDFEHDIEGVMDGIGLAPGPPNAELGAPNAATSADLDALAAYALRGVRVPRAASGDDAARARGRHAFERAACTACHAGPAWTRSRLPGPPGSGDAGATSVTSALRDVGTFDANRDTLGADGFDAPTLLGLHATAPYLHDGRAPDLASVLEDPRHAPALGPGERDDLIAFLLGIDGTTAPIPP